jgi:hypothetical protein
MVDFERKIGEPFEMSASWGAFSFNGRCVPKGACYRTKTMSIVPSMGRMLVDWQILVEEGATHPCEVILSRWSHPRGGGMVGFESKIGEPFEMSASWGAFAFNGQVGCVAPKRRAASLRGAKCLAIGIVPLKKVRRILVW